LTNDVQSDKTGTTLRNLTNLMVGHHQRAVAVQGKVSEFREGLAEDGCEVLLGETEDPKAVEPDG
jgi:hypothetical protein